MSLTKILCCFLSMCFVWSSLPPLSIQAQIQTPQDIFRTSKEDLDTYRLSRYDVLDIEIIGQPARISDIMVGPDGYVNLSYAGKLKLAGLTIDEATAVLTNAYGEYIKIPSMAVMVKQYGPRNVYIMGEVGKQGIYSLKSERMNIFAALSSAGGITKRGRPKHVTVIREIGDQIYMQEIDFDKFIKKQDVSQNIILQDGDMIFVPRSNKIDFYEDIMPIANSIGLFRTLTR